MQLEMARILAAFALLVIVSGEASAQRNAVEAWDPSAREFGRLPVEPGPTSDARNSTLEALNKILSSSRPFSSTPKSSSPRFVTGPSLLSTLT
jgi:hypothetical protein